MKNLESIQKSDYSTMVGWIKERNRPSGGVRTLAEFASRSFLRPGKKILEVGSNTGFSVVNLALLSGAHCSGIDINEDSVAESKSYAAANDVSHVTDFKVGSALQIPFESETFDALWVSNVTSFISNKQDAFKEYLRVLKPNGILGVAPIYYHTEPPSDLLEKVESFVNTKINIKSLKHWKEEIEETARQNECHLVEYACLDYKYDDRADVLDMWIGSIIQKPHLSDWTERERNALVERYKECMTVFNENLKYCCFSLILYQKRIVPEEQELFVTRAL